MAIVMKMHWAGVTPADYDAVRREVGWEEQSPAGGVVHVAWFDSDGLVVVDVWETPEAFDTFAQSRLMPGVAKVGLAGQPVVTIVPCLDHQIETGPSRVGAVGVLARLPITAEMYDALRTKVDWIDVAPVGGISHIAWIDGDAVASLDVWRSVDDCARFADDRVLPAVAALGWPVPTDPGPAPVALHAWFHAAAAA